MIAGQATASPEDRLIVALDFPSGGEALGFVGRLEGVCRWFKVGMELYYAAGNQLVDTLRSKGFEVFLDLKLHDIPNTVAGGVRSVGGIGASLLTVHAGGGQGDAGGGGGGGTGSGCSAAAGGYGADQYGCRGVGWGGSDG